MIDFTQGEWVCQPKVFAITSELVTITTEPNTDFWQRSYYGFRNDNAHALLLDTTENFTFLSKIDFEYQKRFDQCGLIVYLDSNNWFKVSIEYENERFARLGSVVTNLGYSDWATTDISLPQHIWYRISRRGPDFLIESSRSETKFEQMRILHMHKLGETTSDMGKSNPPRPADVSVRFGVYACSPTDSSFTANFSNMKFEPCQWEAHGS